MLVDWVKIRKYVGNKGYDREEGDVEPDGDSYDPPDLEGETMTSNSPCPLISF